MKRPRSLLVLIAAAVALALAPGAAHAGIPKKYFKGKATTEVGIKAPSESAAQELAKKYVPIAEIREETDPPCDTSQEQYQPTSVETVLGNPTVALQHDAEGGKLTTVRHAPTAQQIAGLGEGWYLNLEGTALGNTCVYAKAFKKLLEEGKAPAVTYAHIAREEGHSGFALQYWFFWYFNQFNDLHEGDWEGMQITFDANSPAAALREEPAEIILFQHAGGERASWDNGKVQKEGTHPIVYPAAGSHATFYDSAVYVENGQHGSGLGCDNTTEPLRELALRPILMPGAVKSKGPFAWTSYYGRWGEKEKGFNNGPTGPQTKHQWTEPFAWMAAQRTTSPRLPGGTIAGPQVTKAFCGAVAAASELINLDAQSPPLAILTIVVALALIVAFVGFTKWRPVDIDTLRRRRALGQILRASRQFYGRHWRVLVPIALFALALIGAANFFAGLISESAQRGSSGFHLAWADMLEQFVRPIAQALVAAVVIVVAREALRSRHVGFRQSLRGVRERFWRVVFAQLLATLGVLLLALTIIGLPFALWKLVGWSFVQQEVMFTDKSFRESFRASSELVRGRWFRTARVVLVFYVIGVAAGPMLTFALIFTALPLIWINVIGSLVFALLIPFVAMGETFLYLDLGVREEEEPVPRRGGWRAWAGSRGTPSLTNCGEVRSGVPCSPPGWRVAGRLPGVKLLAFSDLHRDLDQAAKLVEMSGDADVVIGAGDFGSMHEGLEETIGALAPIETPTILVPGNNETVDALRGAAEGWPAAMVLHGEGATIDGVKFFGLGAGIPTTPWGWSFDLSEEEAAEMIAPAQAGSVWVLHSPPYGHCDGGDPDTHFGSKALLAAIEEKAPRLVVFGHIHEAWGCESAVGETPLRNLGPSGTWIEV